MSGEAVWVLVDLWTAGAFDGWDRSAAAHRETLELLAELSDLLSDEVTR